MAKLRFEPRQEAFQWATYIPTRSGPPFKAHESRSHALNAINHVGPFDGCILFERQGDDWVEMYNYGGDEAQDPKAICEICLTPVNNAHRTGRPYWEQFEGELVWARIPGTSRILYPPTRLLSCRGCSGGIRKGV